MVKYINSSNESKCGGLVDHDVFTVHSCLYSTAKNWGLGTHIGTVRVHSTDNIVQVTMSTDTKMHCDTVQKYTTGWHQLYVY